MSIIYDVSVIIGTSLSGVCSIVLLVFWFLNPKWQSLHNFIAIHQIVFGTKVPRQSMFIAHRCKHLCAMNIDCAELWELLITLKDYLFLTTLSWTLCAALVSYLRLVLLLTGKITCGKRLAATFSYGVLFVIVGITDVIVPHIFKLTITLDYYGPRCLSVDILNSINLFLFIFIVKTVLSHGVISGTRRGGTRLISLIGVAILCDLITTLYLILLIPDQLVYVEQGLFFFSSIFNYRLIPQTLVLLFNKKSKEYWKKRKQLKDLKRFRV